MTDQKCARCGGSGHDPICEQQRSNGDTPQHLPCCLECHGGRGKALAGGGIGQGRSEVSGPQRQEPPAPASAANPGEGEKDFPGATRRSGKISPDFVETRSEYLIPGLGDVKSFIRIRFDNISIDVHCGRCGGTAPIPSKENGTHLLPLVSTVLRFAGVHIHCQER